MRWRRAVAELQRQRQRTEELAVELERTRLAGALDAAARDRTRAMLELAERGGPEAFGGIEQLGRESLHDMRELLGTLLPDPEPASPCGHEPDPSAPPTSRARWIAPAATLAAAVVIVIAPDVQPPAAGLVLPAALAYACGAYARGVPGALATASLFAVAAGSSPVPVLICTLGPWLAGRVVRSRERLVAQLRVRTRELEAEHVAQSRSRSATNRRGSRASCTTSSPITWRSWSSRRERGGCVNARTRSVWRRSRAPAGRRWPSMERLVELIGEDDHDVDGLLERARAAGLTIHAPALELDATGYRVVREAVTNVIKHAPGSAVEVRAERGEIEVRDSGRRRRRRWTAPAPGSAWTACASGSRPPAAASTPGPTPTVGGACVPGYPQR